MLVDTSVWIDFFRGVESEHTDKLKMALNHRIDIATCGVVVMEILRGIKDAKQHSRTRSILQEFTFLDMSYHTFLRSSEIYRKVRRHGKTIRKDVDCMIAAVAIENKRQLLHNDKDFLPIAEYCRLQLL